MLVRIFCITFVQKYQKIKGVVREKELGGNNLCLLMEGEGDCIQSHEAPSAAVLFIAGEK